MNYLLQGPSRALLKALCLRDFSHQTLGVFFNTRKSMVFAHHFLNNDGPLGSEKWFSDSMKILEWHIAELHKRRQRQRSILLDFKGKDSQTYEYVSRIYLENLDELEIHFLLDQNSFDRNPLLYNGHWLHDMNTLSPRLLQDKFFYELSHHILGELCLLNYWKKLESLWEWRLYNPEDFEISPDDACSEDHDTDLLHDHSLTCEENLQQIREEILQCERILSFTDKKSSQSFQVAQSYYENMVKILDDAKCVNHHLEDHEAHDDDKRF